MRVIVVVLRDQQPRIQMQLHFERRSTQCESRDAGVACKTEPGLRRGGGVTQEYNVVFAVRADHAEGLAVGRPMICPDQFGGEIGDLVASGAIERLEPEILDAVLANDINQGLPVRSEGQTTAQAGIRIEKLGLRLRAGVEWHEIYFLHTYTRTTCRRYGYHSCQVFAVR